MPPRRCRRCWKDRRISYPPRAPPSSARAATPPIARSRCASTTPPAGCSIVSCITTTTRAGDAPLLELPPDTELAAGLRHEFGALFSPDAALSTVRYRYDEHGNRTEAATWMGAHCIDRRTF